MSRYVSLFFVIKKNNSLGIRCAYRNMVRGEVEPRGVFGGGSLSKNRKKNPFLEKPVREYILDIDPTSIASRIMSVREQKSW